jgi:ABC-type cobalamin transport system permease subunit
MWARTIIIFLIGICIWIAIQSVTEYVIKTLFLPNAQASEIGFFNWRELLASFLGALAGSGFISLMFRKYPPKD